MQNTEHWNDELSADDFESHAHFLECYKLHPERFERYTDKELDDLEDELEERDEQNEEMATQPASKNGTKREETGGSKVGPGNPPVEHRFKPGNPGGPGRPKGPRSIRKIIRECLYNKEMNERITMGIVEALFKKALSGNTHAIKIILDQTSNRPKGKQA